MNDGSSPEGAGPERCYGDLGTRQSPMPREMPVWVGTVPSGCSPLQDTRRVLGEAVAAPQRGSAGISIRDMKWGRKHTVHIFPLYLRINITNG